MTTYRFMRPESTSLPDPVLKAEWERIGDGSVARRLQGGDKPVMRTSTAEWATANRHSGPGQRLIYFKPVIQK